MVAGAYDQLEADKKMFLENMQLYFDAHFHISHEGKSCIFRTIDADTIPVPATTGIPTAGEGTTVFE